MSSSQARKERARQEKLRRKADREIPILEFNFGASGLVFHGPVITTILTIAEQHKEALVKAGLKVPDPVRCRFLIDTGADGCVVKHEFAERAGLKLINPSTTLHGIGVDTSGRTYLGRILFGCDSRTLPGVTHYFAVDAEIESASLNSDKIDGLIGRNVLQHFEINYNGMTGKLVMRFIGAPVAQRLPPQIIP